ncbi:MAG: hypothetical protein NTW93_04045 [Phycisphaerae bacterium]|nr:hypothetical protein [Phycisphaerae bacterium]
MSIPAGDEKVPYNCESLWQDIVIIYQETKKLLLWAEEHEIKKWKTFTQPLLEHRSALDHICRALACEVGILSPNEDYYKKNLDKAKGHIYRAFFDVADWFSVVLRDNITDMLDDFDTDCITAAIPDYYSIIRPDIENITQEIAAIRDGKDISTNNGIISDIGDYRQKIEKLLQHHKTIVGKLRSLNEYKIKHKKHNFRKELLTVVISLVIGIVITIIGNYIWEKVINKKASENLPRTETSIQQYHKTEGLSTPAPIAPTDKK